MIDDAEDRGRRELLDALRSIAEQGRELLALIDRGLPARDEAGVGSEPDLAGLRLRLTGPIDRVIADCDRLGSEAVGPGREELAADVAKVRAAVLRLIELVDDRLLIDE